MTRNTEHKRERLWKEVRKLEGTPLTVDSMYKILNVVLDIAKDEIAEELGVKFQD